MKQYLRGIDGLRAIAVAAVVLFHAFPTLLPGGFIGVDIFFVISGFIITRTYFDDLGQKRISLRHFYLKRVRRLAPAYVIVLFATTVAAFLILTPPLLNSYATSLAAQPIYLQNFAFWDQGDYFEKALGKPLLHTWSLAVEEQFYLLYGILIVIAIHSRRLAWTGLALAFAGSLAFGHMVADASPKTAFYWLPARIWEFGVGIYAARATIRLTSRPASALGYLGLGLIAIAVVAFSEAARFPGIQSMLACAGTALALYSIGTGTWQPRLLENAVAVHLGRISYSLYLWHWPLIALLATALGHPLSAAEAFISVVASWILAWTSERLVETPVRRSIYLKQPRTLILTSVAAGALTIAFAGWLSYTDGAVNRYSPEIARLYRAEQQRAPFRCSLFQRIRSYPSEMCRINDVKGPGGILIIGDSHADQLHEMLASIGTDLNIPVYLAVRNCNLETFTEKGFCGKTVLRRLGKDIEKSRVKYIVATSYMKDNVRAEALKNSLEVIAKTSVERIFIMQDVPHGDYFSPKKHLEALVAHTPLPQPMTLVEYDTETSTQREALQETAATEPKVSVLHPAPVLCPNGTCLFDNEGNPLYFDTHHLSPTGVRLLREMFRNALSGST